MSRNFSEHSTQTVRVGVPWIFLIVRLKILTEFTDEIT